LGSDGSKQQRRKDSFKAIVLVPVGSNPTREVPTPPLGNPRTNTTHERAPPRGETRAWYERKVDRLPR